MLDIYKFIKLHAEIFTTTGDIKQGTLKLDNIDRFASYPIYGSSRRLTYATLIFPITGIYLGIEIIKYAFISKSHCCLKTFYITVGIVSTLGLGILIFIIQMVYVALKHLCFNTNQL